MGKYTVSADGKTLVSASRDLPTIKLGIGLGRLSSQSLAAAINKKIAASPRAYSELSFYAAEGIVLNGITRQTQANLKLSVDPTRLDGFAIYPGWDKPAGTFIDTSAKFELQAFINMNAYSTGGTVNYDSIVETIIHEGIGHPRYGRHVWNNYPGDYQRVLSDKVYNAEFVIESQSGKAFSITGAASQFFKSKLPTIKAGDSAVSVTGYKQLLRDAGVSEQDIAARSGEYTGSYHFKSNGVEVWVLSDAEYMNGRAIIQQNEMERRFKVNGGAQRDNTVEVDVYKNEAGVLRFVQKFGREIVDLDGGQLGAALGSVLGKRLTSSPFGQILASSTLSVALGATGEFIDKFVLGGTSQTTNFLNGNTPIDPTTGLKVKSFGDNLGQTLLSNIKSAGIGALSSYLTAELARAAGLNGLPGEVANSFGSAAVSQVIANLPKVGTTYQVVENGQTVTKTHTLFEGVAPTLIANVAASYLGGKLANAIYQPQSVGGQSRLGIRVVCRGSDHRGFRSQSGHLRRRSCSGCAVDGGRRADRLHLRWHAAIQC